MAESQLGATGPIAHDEKPVVGIARIKLAAVEHLT